MSAVLFFLRTITDLPGAAIELEECALQAFLLIPHERRNISIPKNPILFLPLYCHLL